MQTYLVRTSDATVVVAGSKFNVSVCGIPTSDGTGLGKDFNCDDIGPYIEGLSIIANITRNDTYVQMHVRSLCRPFPFFQLTWPLSIQVDGPRVILRTLP